MGYCRHMTTKQLITTAELATLRGVTPQAITAAIRRKRLEPAYQLRATGMYLFDPETVAESDPKQRVA